MGGVDGREAVLRRFGLGAQDRLGEGGESEVFALDAHRVLRVHKREAAGYTRAIGELYAGLDRSRVPYALPEVLAVDGDGELSWSIERRLPGRSLDQVLPFVAASDRERVLRGYVDAAAAFGALGAPPGWPGGCGELFTDERLRADRWGELQRARLTLQLEQARPVLEAAIPELGVVAARVLAEAEAAPNADAPTLVHGDWCPGNVLVGDDLRITAAFDLGWLTTVGHPCHDLLTAAVFCEPQAAYRPDDAAVLADAVSAHLGPDTAVHLARTRRLEALRFAFVTEDPFLHRWCLAVLCAA